MEEIDVHEVVFPVVTLKDGNPDYLGLWGTAFCVGGDYFLTARHVLDAATRSLESGHADHMAIGQPDLDNKPEREWEFTTFTELQVDPRLDVGIFRVEENFTKIFAPKWNGTGLHLLEDVRAAGYPYSLDLRDKVINLRAIKGHVIGTGRQRTDSVQYQSYELNFLAPRGLSGAPLCDNTPLPQVCGIVIGNKSHEMEVASMQEIIGDGERIETFTRIEVMHIGVAIQAKELLSLQFELINGSIADHLKKYGLL